MEDAALTRRERAWTGMIKARMNVIYYDRLVARSERADKVLRLTSALIASGGVAGALKWLDSPGLAIALGIVSAVIGAAGMILGIADRSRAASAILPRYVEHYNRLAWLFERPEVSTVEDVDQAIRAMDESAVIEAEKLKTSDPILLKVAYNMAMAERGLPSPLRRG